MQAFVASSEDPLVGTCQKGQSSQNIMNKIYCGFPDDHKKIASSLFEAVPSTTSQATTFNQWTPKSIFNRFNHMISLRVIIFIAISEVTPRKSGKNENSFFDQ